MPRTRWPRRGSMQFWPRKRAKKQQARIRSWPKINDVKPLGFAGYKVGMTHLTYIDANKNSLTKGEEISCPVTVIECPPLKIIGFQAYSKDDYGLKIFVGGIINATKQLSRRLKINKKEITDKINEVEKNIDKIHDIRILVQTQPYLTGIGKKKPEIFEIGLGGDDVKLKLDYIKNNLGKDIFLKDVFKEGEVIDSHSVTKGKGTQGPVKRFGVAIRSHKAEKTKRGPATLGPWHPHHGNYTVPHAGKMGYHQRTQMNYWIMKITNEKINPKSGWKHYGIIKNECLILKGSVGGPQKRLIKMTSAYRKNKKIQESPPEIVSIMI
ncbi:MAG: 50S ribosomal protein L3 [Candidatus Woesearchaeota archaeon]